MRFLLLCMIIFEWDNLSFRIKMRYIRFWIFALCVVLLGSCALPPKPTAQNSATLSIDFYSEVITNPKSKPIHRSVLTYWRKLNPDGTKGDRFAIGGANAFNRAMNTSRFRKQKEENLKLDAGLYYLDSFEVMDRDNKQILISQRGDYTERNGWNDETNQPRYFMLKLKENQHLKLQAKVNAIDSIDSIDSSATTSTTKKHIQFVFTHLTPSDVYTQIHKGVEVEVIFDSDISNQANQIEQAESSNTLEN